jgi:beta-phosphoglucomutase-like phosphatase (HAD superfamily)
MAVEAVRATIGQTLPHSFRLLTGTVDAGLETQFSRLYRIAAILRRAGLERAVDLIVGAEDVTEHKPHPQGLLSALEQLGVVSARAVYVGDHPLDAEAAARAGLLFIAVLTVKGLSDHGLLLRRWRLSATWAG